MSVDIFVSFHVDTSREVTRGAGAGAVLGNGAEYGGAELREMSDVGGVRSGMLE